MPTFPKHYGSPLPEVLNPLNPYHYLLLLDWIFFKPSRLKQYLHRVDSDLYRQKGLKSYWRALRFPAYRNLILIASCCFTFAVLISISWWMVISEETPFTWSSLVFIVALSAILGMIAMIESVVIGAVMGSTVNLVVDNGLTVPVLAGVMTVGLVMVEALRRVVTGEMMGVPFAKVPTMVLSFAVGVLLGSESRRRSTVLLGVVIGGMMGVIEGVTVGVRANLVGWRWMLVMAGGLVVWGVPMILGVTRSIFYIFQILPAAWLALKPGSAIRRLSLHPVLADELAVLPFPGLVHLLYCTLEEDFLLGLQNSRFLLRNSLQRWVVGRAFTKLFAHASSPLELIYRALSMPILDEYVIEPSYMAGFRRLFSVRVLWLSEMANVFSCESNEYIIRSIDLFTWKITRPLRGKPDSRIAPLGKLLLALLDDEVFEKEGLAPDLLAAAGNAVQVLPHGCELQRSFASLADGLTIVDLPALAAQRRALADCADLPEPPLRPQIVQALQGLGDIAAEVEWFLASTSPTTQADALNRAIGMLNELAHYVEDINLPERSLLRLVIHHWQDLVAKAAGRLGEQALREIGPDARGERTGMARRASFWVRPAEPYPNPYKAGDPVYPPLFVGRQDISNYIREVWSSKTNPDSIILYGHRRMGKSSILRNLAVSAPKGSLLVYADLKGRTAFVTDTASLLHELADEIAWVVQNRNLVCEEPNAGDYHDPAKAALAFRRLLRQVLAVLPPDSSLILALDEFEAIDNAVSEGKIDRRVYDYLRELSQQPRVVLVFAGLHSLDEMSRDYRQAFFNSYINIRVSYLPQQAIERLIVRPTPDFPLNYAPEVVQRIIIETHGQPLLVQRICQELVNRINHELFDLNLEREARVLPDDLAEVLSDDFLQSESRYFDGIWNDQIAGDDAASEVLQALSSHGPLTAKALAERIALPLAQITATLDYLEVRDLVGNTDGIYDLRIPLMRRWLQLKIANTHAA